MAEATESRTKQSSDEGPRHDEPAPAPETATSPRPVVTIRSTDLKAEFDRASGGDGYIDFSEIGAIEEKFGLSMSISTDMKYWKDMKVTYREFVDMLKRNGNIAQGGDVKLQVRRAEVDAAFREAGGVDGILDFNDIGKVEMKYSLPMNISGDMKYWQDMKITKDEFMEMLERNGNLIPELEESAMTLDLASPAETHSMPAAASKAVEGAAVPQQERVKAVVTKYVRGPGEFVSLAALLKIIRDCGGTDWSESRLAALVEDEAKSGQLQVKDGQVLLGEFFSWCLA